MSANRLYRARDDRMHAGVAGGLVELRDGDPSLVRLVRDLLVIFTGGIVVVLVPAVRPAPGTLPSAGPDGGDDSA